MSDDNWKPTASQQARRARASLLATIRQFFAQRGVMEVDTPLLSHGTVTDVYLDAFITQFDHSHTGNAQSLYLQTSPEYAMKRLLCDGSGPIYQICKAFRHEGAGRWHNPEFTMLEWYRPGFTHIELMQEVDALLQLTLGTEPASYLTYQQAFLRYLQLDPLTVSSAQLNSVMQRHSIDIDDLDRLTVDDKLQLLFGVVIEPQIGLDSPCFIHGFPASQAALARLNQNDPRVADRFEVYFQGAELANGFYELADAPLQAARFAEDNTNRETQGLPVKPVDQHLLDALVHGLPDCAGVALGVDRLLMLKTQASHIEEVINFPVSRA